MGEINLEASAGLQEVLQAISHDALFDSAAIHSTADTFFRSFKSIWDTELPGMAAAVKQIQEQYAVQFLKSSAIQSVFEPLSVSLRACLRELEQLQIPTALPSDMPVSESRSPAEIEVPEQFYDTVEAVLSHPAINPEAIETETADIVRNRPKKLTDVQIDRLLNFIYFLLGTIMLTLAVSHASGVEAAAQHEEAMQADAAQTELLEEIADNSQRILEILEDIGDALHVAGDESHNVCDCPQCVPELEDAAPQASSAEEQSNAEQALTEPQS